MSAHTFANKDFKFTAHFYRSRPDGKPMLLIDEQVDLAEAAAMLTECAALVTRLAKGAESGDTET